MITWMQRHKKYLIITIWISTIAFVGAGFVGWGQYDYGNKAGAIAKVGEIKITNGELQKTYSNMYNYYNQMFQGNFDKEKAKAFGLEKQALRQLSEQALVLNLALEYDLKISNEEVFSIIKEQKEFQQDGVFNAQVYKQMFKDRRLSLVDYEESLKKQLLVSKVYKLLTVQASENEKNILNTVVSISDKITYELLSDENITVDTSDATLKPFWEIKKHSFMSDVVYELEYLKQSTVSNNFDNAKISSHYQDNRTHFKGEDGKILSQDLAKDLVITELNAKATKDAALRTYISYKKGKLSADAQITKVNVSSSNNPFNEEVLEKISALSITAPYLKPVSIDGNYYTIKLLKIHPSKVKSFEDAKSEVLPIYVTQTKKEKLLALANNLLASFEGTQTDFITIKDANKLTNLSLNDANNFLNQLFTKQDKRSMIALDNGKIVLYDILEQKMLTNTNSNNVNSIANIKSTLFNQGLIKNLENKYTTEIFIEGL